MSLLTLQLLGTPSGLRSLMDDAHMWVRMWAGRRGHGRSGPQSGTALIRREQIAWGGGGDASRAGAQTNRQKCQRQRGWIKMRERQVSSRRLKEMADNDKWCLMPKENGGGRRSKSWKGEWRSNVELSGWWRRRGNVTAQRNTEGENNGEALQSDSESKAGGEENGMERWESVERGGESNYSRVWGGNIKL